MKGLEGGRGWREEGKGRLGAKRRRDVQLHGNSKSEWHLRWKITYPYNTNRRQFRRGKQTRED